MLLDVNPVAFVFFINVCNLNYISQYIKYATNKLTLFLPNVIHFSS